MNAFRITPASATILIIAFLTCLATPAAAQNGHWEYATSTVYGAGSAGIRQENLSVEEIFEEKKDEMTDAAGKVLFS